MKNIKGTVASSLATLMLLTGCVSPPLGPTVAVMPGPNKPFDAFAQDQAVCKEFAQAQVSGSEQTATNQALIGAGVGTLLGAGLGAAIGGGRGAAIGAGSGAVAGTAVAAGPANAAQYTIQQRYDIAYQQCMYSRGNQVPGYTQAPPSAPPAGEPPPPPPPGYPPPPPPPR